MLFVKQLITIITVIRQHPFRMLGFTIATCFTADLYIIKLNAFQTG